MAKRERQPPSKPSNAYLVSFGDTMTAMLAFFIVLNTLAQEQTGANLHAGTGSFINAMSSMGLPGSFGGDRSKRVQQMNDAAPKYIVNPDGTLTEGSGVGPDENDDGLPVIDWEYENLQRTLIEFDEFFEVNQIQSNQTSVVMDVFDRIGKGEAVLTTNAKKILVRSLKVLTLPNYRVEIKVWATTPGKTAITRASKQATEIKAVILQMFPMLDKKRVQCVASMWPFSDDKRPTLSVIIVKRELE